MKKYEILNSFNWEVLGIYEEVIKKLESMKIGKRTEYKTEVTEELINNVKKRYAQLCKNTNGIAIS